MLRTIKVKVYDHNKDLDVFFFLTAVECSEWRLWAAGHCFGKYPVDMLQGQWKVPVLNT